MTKIKKFIILTLMLVTMFSFSFLNENANIVNAATEGYKYVPTSDGGYATYLHQDLKVEVPVNYEKKTTEFRGIWVSAYAGDIQGFESTQAAFQSQLLGLLENMEKYNLNAVIFHIRTHNDALYDTDMAPKSHYVSAANFREWDYLEWFIDECHKRGIEFHAWMNPYRIYNTPVTLNEILNKYAKYYKNPARKAENILMADRGAILDPGSPEVKKYLVDTCMEVIKKYDVDAIHFDDYFYASGIDDAETFNKYHDQYNTNSIETFRRLQVDEFIHNLSEEMYKYNIAHNRSVQLGISPSGVYRNGSYTTEYKYDSEGTLVSPIGSNSRGYAHYDDPLYSDVKKWVDNEWIDYVTPQLYGSFENSAMRYADMVDWWSHVVRNKKVNFYPGLGIYKMNDNSDTGWKDKNLTTFSDSLLYNQKFPEVKGFILYQYRTIKNNMGYHKDLTYVFNEMLNTKALTPKCQRYETKMDNLEDLSVYKGNNNYTIKINKVNSASKYAIYKSVNNIDVNDPSQLIGIFSGKDIVTYIDNETRPNINYGIIAMSNSNYLSNLKVINTKDAKDKLDFPFAKINKVDYEGRVTENAFINFTFEQVDLYAGSPVKYKIYKSTDKENWELIDTINNPVSIINSVSFQFNNQFRPEFLKLVVENEFGTIDSEIVKVDYHRLKVDKILDFMLSEFDKDMKEFFR